MRPPSTVAIKLEHEALDKIHTALERPENRRGLTARQLADQTGLAIGYVQRTLNASEIVLRRRVQNSRLWWADWRDVEPAYRPKRHQGRPVKLTI